MPLIAETKNGKTFELPKEGTVQGVLAEVRDLGMLDQVFNGKAKKVHKVLFRWQLAELDEEKQPKRLYERFTLSLHEKAGLRKRIKEMTGKEPPPTLDVEKLVGFNNLLVVIHNDKDGKTYANIAACLKLPPGTPKLDIVAIPLTKSDIVAAAKTGPVTEDNPIDDSDLPF